MGEPEPPSTLGRLLADGRPSDPVGLGLAQGRIAAELFGVGGADGLGRLQLLNRLAAGGMGVIYAAYDPDLERSVAVKVVPVSRKGSADALAEAKALARLSHPNVVPVFDVGIVGEHLYIVMELVLGKTLRRWAVGRTSRDVVKAYRQAGEALAAAHAAGLVHRDFKPENAIMGQDGRVRVVDFGLACEAAEPNAASGAGRPPAGTPRFMAPEQLAGGAITPAADQFGFCTALAEGLASAGDRGAAAALPRWLQAVIDRGRATDPRARFTSMNELLHALARDPALLRRRRILLAVAALGGVAAFVSGRATLATRSVSCDSGDARLATVWGPAGRGAALERLAGLSDYGRLVGPRLEALLAEHGRRWSGTYRDACVAHESGARSDAMLDRGMACLERGRAALRSVATLIETAKPDALPGLVLAARDLPAPEACADPGLLLSGVEPPDSASASAVADARAQLEDARVQIAAGRAAQARTVADAVVSRARALGYRPLLVEAQLVSGHASIAMDDRAAAIAPLREATTSALEIGDQSLAVEAWARRAWSEGTHSGAADSLSGLDVVQAVAAQKAVSPFARALLYNNVGSVEIALERRHRARASFERAAREAPDVVGRGAIELLNIGQNLALVTDDPEARDRILEESAAAKASALGKDHPETLETQRLRGMTHADTGRAVELLTPACLGLAMHGHPLAAFCWAEVGFLRGELGDAAGAITALERASATQATDGRHAPVVLPFLAFWQGRLDVARRGFEDALRARPPTPTAPFWDRMERAELELGLGRALRAAGRSKEAKKTLKRSLADLTDVARSHPAPITDRRLARARAELAALASAQ